ncbi:MAG TPA: DUF3347 domain-containing protein [Hanamia sp.]|nr:DUF3347 domain-containing protein [Hanamia sp.]
MKKSVLAFVAAMVVIISCKSNSSSNAESAKMSRDNEIAIRANDNIDDDLKTISPTFTDVNPGISSFMKSVVQNYLTIKNALVKGDEVTAATASFQLENEMKIFDKSLFANRSDSFAVAQKEVYDNVEVNLKNEADSISKSKIDSQREHFFVMSKDVYALVKAFGTGIPLYSDNCPMYHNGAMWLSEITEIKNPYLGTKMMGCGSIEERFQ